jgi:tetratricopeptide (TPR) repeat protein
MTATASTRADLKAALALVPDHPLALSVSCNRAMQTEHEEDALSYCRASSKKMSSGEPGISPRLASAYKFNDDANVAMLTGDFDAMRNGSRVAAAQYGANAIGAEDMEENDFVSRAGQHDRSGMWKALATLPAAATLDPQTKADRLWAIFLSDAHLGDWRAVVTSAAVVERAQRTGYPGADNDTQMAAGITPWFALGKAKLGDLAGADRLIATTNPQCILCLRVRGDIAAIERRWDAADRWFADAAKQAPSIPAVYLDWGRMLLAKGDVDGAIAKFTLATQKGPHFADPMEMWGEALIAKNRSDLALAKFEEANRYAPNWGRLHLKWGEALMWSGDKAGAQKQFAAAHLDLTPSEKSELARMESIHG